MRVITGINNVETMLRMYRTVKAAPETSARGRKFRNIHNMAVELDGRVCPVTSFDDRKFNLDYAKREWQWYLGADKMDDSIMKHATMWAKLKQDDGSFFSNYGQYMFGAEEGKASQFHYVVSTLKDDPGSRRASMVLLQRNHLFKENTDTVCTYAINFTIDQGYLMMTVMMRSNDVIFGFTNDAFCFWHLFMFVYTVLQHHMPDLKIGGYTHFTNSMHVYDTHYDMIARIVNKQSYGYKEVRVPRPTLAEVISLIDSKGKEGKGEYSEWIAS